jgi:hypothetical protein
MTYTKKAGEIIFSYDDGSIIQTASGGLAAVTYGYMTGSEEGVHGPIDAFAVASIYDKKKTEDAINEGYTADYIHKNLPADFLEGWNPPEDTEDFWEDFALWQESIAKRY